MNLFSAHDILRLWETGQTQHPIDRTLTILSAALPDMTYDSLARLPVGKRDSLMLAIREKNFGDTINAFSECPQCSECLEFLMNTSDIGAAGDTPPESNNALLEVTEDDTAFRFRLPDSTDLDAVVGLETKDARIAVLKRCIMAMAEGESVNTDEIVTNSDIADAIIQRMADCSAGPDVVLDLICPSCKHQFQRVFDIASYLWMEVSSEAKRLLREVHMLAHAYGWAEADILAMSNTRRHMYLEMVS